VLKKNANLEGDILLMNFIADLSICGWKYHDNKSNKYSYETKEYAYHVYMMELYSKILGLAIDSDKLRKRYLR